MSEKGDLHGKRGCGIIELSDKECKLIETLRAILYGEVTVFMQDGQPVRIEELRKSIKL